MLVCLWLVILYMTDPKRISLSLGLNRHDANNNETIYDSFSLAQVAHRWIEKFPNNTRRDMHFSGRVSSWLKSLVKTGSACEIQSDEKTSVNVETSHSAHIR